MLKNVLKKLFTNIKLFVPFIVISLIYQIIIVKLDILNFQEGTFIDDATNSINFALMWKQIFISIIFSLIMALFLCYVWVLIGKIVRGYEVNHLDTFKDSLNYYPRFIGIDFIFMGIFTAILFLIIVLRAIPVIGIILLIIGLIFFIYIETVLYSTSKGYMIYTDGKIGESMSNGYEIGKKNFWMLLLLGILGVIPGKIAAINCIKTNILAFILVSIANALVELFVAMYAITLCKNYFDEKVIS